MKSCTPMGKFAGEKAGMFKGKDQGGKAKPRHHAMALLAAKKGTTSHSTHSKKSLSSVIYS